jgi:G3E family GTPase
VRFASEEIIEMMNGCICCTYARRGLEPQTSRQSARQALLLTRARPALDRVRQDLIVVLNKLAKRIASGKLHLDGILIETTGMADPAPVAQTFFVDDQVKAFARLDGIVTLVRRRQPHLTLSPSLSSSPSLTLTITLTLTLT